jgi:succinate dehydrogenase/fumarate reductase flavoprotein subunit
MVNRLGMRFVDEGEDFRNYTYAKFGRAILQQPEGYAFQIWDRKTVDWLREEEYGDGVVEKITAETLEELAQKLSSQGLEDTKTLLKTMSQFNEAAQSFKAECTDAKWDPSIKDGLSTGSALPLPKSNWALPIDTPPYLAVKVACGITFTFGGVAIDPKNAQIIQKDTNKGIRGLFACGEMVGGLFYSNYPGGSGLTAGAVFGRRAGQEASKIKWEHTNE